jgi:hypothetical protein
MFATRLLIYCFSASTVGTHSRVEISNDSPFSLCLSLFVAVVEKKNFLFLFHKNNSLLIIIKYHMLRECKLFSTRLSLHFYSPSHSSCSIFPSSSYYCCLTFVVRHFLFNFSSSAVYFL